MSYNDNIIKEKAVSKGFTVLSIDREYVTMRCTKGHYKGCPVKQLIYQEVICRICDGKRFDLPKAVQYIESFGYSLAEDPELENDRFGNKVIKAAKRIKLICPEGHEQSVNLTEFSNGKRCTTCSGTIMNVGFSRSEEIIARTFDYLGINYSRQASSGDKFENVHLDFYLPDYKLIIEYDGEHHVYGRSTSTEEQLEEIQRRDRLRDDYAAYIGFRMVRISHLYAGKVIIHELAKALQGYTYINVNDSYYDSIVREVFNECASRFGWLTYEDMKFHADTYLNNSLSKSAKITGASQTVIARHFRWIYGMNKADYIKRVK